MGKKAVPVAHLENDQNRRNTFKKRLIGLMKKAHDLSVLCDAQIAVIIIDENKEIFPYTNNNSIEEIWEQYSSQNKKTKAKSLSECKKVLKFETNKAEKARQVKKDTHQKIHQNIGLHHQTNWDNKFITCMLQQQINEGSTSSSIQQEQVKWGCTSHTMSHLQPNALDENHFQMVAQNGPNISIAENTTPNANGNNWSCDTNGTNYENEHHFYQEHQTAYYITNVDLNLQDTNTLNQQTDDCFDKADSTFILFGEVSAAEWGKASGATVGLDMENGQGAAVGWDVGTLQSGMHLQHPQDEKAQAL